MTKRDKTTRDSFALSLGGVTAVTTFCAMPAISYERLRQDQAGTANKPRQLNWRDWMRRNFRVV